MARGRLRNLDAGLCLDVRGGRVRADARIVLTACSDGSPQWSYQDDGLLRSAADPTLCLGSGTAGEPVDLAGCLVHSGVVRYDLTVRGELLPRGGRGLAVAPGKGRHVIVTARDGSDAQRWALEPAVAREEAGESRKRRPRDSQVVPREKRHEKKGPYSDAPSAHPPRSPRARSEQQLPPDRYEPRIAQVACCDEPDPGPDDTAAPGPDVLGRATAGVARTALTLHAATLP